jgi:hypothetical protein
MIRHRGPTEIPRRAGHPPLTDCPAQFGNNDIYGGTYLDPTP